jgi:hypothetical protein
MKAQRIDTVRKFFEAIVEVDAAEFNAEQTDLRLAYHSCISLLSLRAWIAETHKYKPWAFCRDPKNPFSNERDLAKELNLINTCFSIVADIANTTKHMIRSERRKTATTSIVEIRSVRNGSMLGIAEFNGAMLNDPSGEFIEEWITTEIGGVSYDVVHCVNSTLALWRTLIAENSWLD